MHRRRFLSYAYAPALAALGVCGPRLLPPSSPHAAQPAAEGAPFSVDWLKDRARRLASQPYQPPAEVIAALVDIDYDAYQAIRFREDRALWRADDFAFQVRLFHLGAYFRQPVAIHEMVAGGARPIAYSADLFEYDRGRFEFPPLPADLGFAGFRVHFHTDFERDMAAFLGASYFRAVGWRKQYGLSARGLAIDTGLPRPEEFPAFRAFWLERPAPGQTALVVHALLDSESVAGAYSFTVRPGRTTTMDATRRSTRGRRLSGSGSRP